MRRLVFVVLALAILAIGAGIFVYNAGWLTPAAAVSTTTLSSSTNADSAAGAVTAPSVDQVGAAAPVSGQDGAGEPATFTYQGHACDHAQGGSADAGY